jgi:arylsulfatase A-like enzyme
VLENNPPSGGFEEFRGLGREGSTVATWLDGRGYETAYVGRYLNGYGQKATTEYVPPGWDEWRVRLGGHIGRTYEVNDNGEIETYGREDFSVDTDYFSREAEEFVRGNAEGHGPWFMVVGVSAPHKPAFSAKRHKDLFEDAEMPTPPSFNEEDVSDKPNWVRKQPQLDDDGIAKAEEEWRQRQRSLQAVDDLVGNLMNALEETGQLGNTYVVYASDNGYLLYRHREHSKGAPYEEAIGVPLVVRGPGVPEGEAREQLVANTDWAPTIADWAGAEPPGFVDGRSFSPLLDQKPPEEWRERLLIEFFKENREFSGLRTANGKTYVEYGTGERELYDLGEDPYQLENLLGAEADASSGSYAAELDSLKGCSAEDCRTAEGS